MKSALTLVAHRSLSVFWNPGINHCDLFWKTKTYQELSDAGPKIGMQWHHCLSGKKCFFTPIVSPTIQNFTKPNNRRLRDREKWTKKSRFKNIQRSIYVHKRVKKQTRDRQTALVWNKHDIDYATIKRVMQCTITSISKSEILKLCRRITLVKTSYNLEMNLMIN